MTFARLLVPWEAIEHVGPGIYDEAFIKYLLLILDIAHLSGNLLFYSSIIYILFVMEPLDKNNDFSINLSFVINQKLLFNL